MWYNYIILLLAMFTGILQLFGAVNTRNKFCRNLKCAYAVSLFIASFIIVLMEIVQESEYGYAMALVSVVFTIMVGSIVRIINIMKKMECPPSEY